VTAFASRSSTPAAWRNWGLQAGARADLLLLNPLDTALRGLADSYLLDGVVFASPQQPPARTLVAGCWAIRDTTALAKRAAQALAELAQGGETAA
jgi:cytosine/adenosine deaminase-related metal-dependent hydrolase